MEILSSLENGSPPRPIIAVIGDFQDILGPIESCKARLEFVFLEAVPREADFWSQSQIRGAVFAGLSWFGRFRETEAFDQLGLVIAVNDLDEYSAALEAGASSVLIKPLSGDALLRQLETQLQIVSDRNYSERLLSGQKEVLEMIARGAAFESTIEALASLVEKVEPDLKCAISTLNSDEAAFSNVYAPSLPRPCKVRLLQMPVGPTLLNPNSLNDDHYPATLCADLLRDGQSNGGAWARALIAEGFRCCLFVPILDSKQRPLAVFSLLGRSPAKLLTSNSPLAQTVAHLAAITLEKRAREEELETERERLSLALAGGQLGIWDWDLITNKLEWSEQCKILFGYSPETNVTFEEFLAVLHPKDRHDTMKAIEDSIRDDLPYDVEYRVVHPNGAVRWIAATGRTFKDDFDRPMRMGGVARDVTERRQFDEALQENQYQLRTALNAAELARREAETATKAKDQFLAVLSHELRTPLTPIMMAANWLRSAQENSEPARDAFDMILRNVELEARLIDDLLDLTRIARNQLELQFRVVDLHTVLRAAIEVCETGVQEKEQRLNIQLSALRSHVRCDFARIQQVFWNLLKNAIKFTPDGGVIFVTSRNEKNDIIVEVSDSGIGIDPKIIEKIFVPFEQGDKDIVKQFGGLGLGLAISKAVVDAHGGAIAVQSAGKDLGAAFTVCLRFTSEPGRSGNVVEK